MPKPRINPIKTDTAAIGKNLKLYRKNRGFTQKDLAESIGVTRETVAAYEAGRGRLLDVTLIDIAKVLKTSSDEILGIKKVKLTTNDMSLRLIKRMNTIETLPEAQKKRILRNLDDAIFTCQHKC